MCLRACVLACLVAASLNSAGHVKGSPLLDELGPCVCKNQVLNAQLGIVKDVLTELGRDFAPVANNVEGALRVHAMGSVIERSARIGAAAAFAATDDSRGVFKHGLEALEVCGGEVDLELGVGCADEFHVDLERAFEALAGQFFDKTFVLL